MKHTLSLLLACLFLISFERNGESQLIRFDNIWTSPYRQSNRYVNSLINEEGKYLFILNKTEWAYFACVNPEAVLDKVKKHGANVIRVCLEGKPYFDVLGYDIWPWKGTREEPDYLHFNNQYWDEVERRFVLAGKNGIGIDLVLYMNLRPESSDVELQKKYWQYAISRLSRYSNLLTWEIMNEYSRNESFQDSAGMYFHVNDPYRHPVCSSDGTTENALWPQKSWMDLAIVHTCTGQDPYDLEYWYLNIARNIRQYGKPAFNNETGREKRHRNDDPVHRRKQSWLFNIAGCYWTWHSWDGCEGINDTAYYYSGWEYLKPLSRYFQSVPFWSMVPSYTVMSSRKEDLITSALSAPENSISVMYCCTRETGRIVKGAEASIRIRNGLYTIKFIDPKTLDVISSEELESKGLKDENSVALPEFTDDLLVQITRKEERKQTLIGGTL